MRNTRLGVGSVILAGAMLLAGCSTFKAPDDSGITLDIQAKLFNDPVLKTQDIRVSSQKGVVTLSGTVNTDLEKAAAERFADQVEGVKNVVNLLTVGSAAQPIEASPAAETSASQAAEPAPERAEKPQRVRHHKARTEEEVASLRPTNYAEGAAPDAEPATEAASNPAPAAQTASTPPADSAPAPQSSPPSPAPQPPAHITIPSGTVVTIRTIDSIDSHDNRPGEEFAASVEAPVVVGDRVVVPRGSDARVRLVNAKSAGKLTGSSELQLELISMMVHGKTYTTQSGYYEQHGASRGKRTAETVGGGAVLGALVGGLLGHGKGAAIGSAVGAGAGTAAQVATKGEQVKVPAETKLDFTLKAPVDITLGSGA